MNVTERLAIVNTIKDVVTCWVARDHDGTVIETLKAIRKIYPEKEIIFANGGDRNSIEDIPESATCADLDIKMVFHVGGHKIQASSTLIKKAAKQIYDKRTSEHTTDEL
jgi:hypothetical protein